MLKILCREHVVSDFNGEETAGTFYKNEQQKQIKEDLEYKN